MSLQQRSKNTSPYKKSIQSILQSPVEVYWRQLYHSDNPSPVHKFAPIQDTRSVIQKLLQVKEFPNLYKSPSLQYSNLYTKKGLLVQTEERIFAEVLNLMDEIDKLKLNMIEEGEGIRKLQIERPDVQEQVNFHGYAEKLTLKQCNDLLTENNQLSKKIDQYRLKDGASLEEILNIERQKYEDLKMGLAEKLPQQANKIKLPQQVSKMSESRIKQLKQQIQDLQKERDSLLRNEYPDFDRIKQMNEELRLKTIQNLKLEDRSSDELIELREYFHREEQNRRSFMEQLKKFKNEYKRMKGENDILKEKLSQRRNYETKENNINSYNRSKVSTKSLQKESYLPNQGLRSERFGEYESIIKEMQYLKH